MRNEATMGMYGPRTTCLRTHLRTTRTLEDCVGRWTEFTVKLDGTETLPR